MLNDSDLPVSEDVVNITTKTLSPTYKRKTSEDCLVTLAVNGTRLKFKIDSGSQVNILSNQLTENKSGLKHTHIKLIAYNDTSIPVLGKCVVQIPHTNRTYNVSLIVADTDVSPIHGLKTSADIELVQRVLSISKREPAPLSKFKECFGGLETFPGYPHITLDPKVTPIINPPRKVSFDLKQKLKQELQRMNHLGIIVPVTEPTDGGSPL